MIFEKWLREWLIHYVKPTVKDRTYQRYKIAVDLHIIPALGTLQLSEITNSMLQHLVSELLSTGNKLNGQGLSSNSINTIICILKNCLATASMLGYIGNNPAEHLKRPKREEKAVSCFTVKEQKAIEKAVFEKKGKFVGILLCLYSGLRLGELLALEWSDVDFKLGILSVNKTCYYCKDENAAYSRVTYAPKTKSSIREIPLPKPILGELRELKKQAQTPYIIENRGKPVAMRCYQKSFETLLKKLDIPYKSFHSLRHSFATRALECGMDVRTLSEILGHKNPTVTLNRYAHSLMEHKISAMNKLGKLLS